MGNPDVLIVGGGPVGLTLAIELGQLGIRCELVVYEDEGHTIEKLANRIDCFTRAAAFLDEVLEP